MNKRLRLLVALYTLCCAILGLLAGGWVLAIKPLWAFSFLIYVPLWLRALGASLLLGCTYLGLYTGTLPKLQAASRSLPRLPGFLWTLLAGLLFWFFRERTWHGDALLKVELLRTQTLQSDPYVWKEPLDSLLAYTVSGWLRPFGHSPATAIAWLSVLAGMAYITAVIYLSRLFLPHHYGAHGAPQPAFRLPHVLALLAVGSSQLWFGHVENYSLVTAATFSAVVLALGYQAGRAPLWAVGLVSGLAVSFHPQAAFTLPALLLLLRREQWLQQLLTLLGAGLVAPLLTGLGLLLAGAPLPEFANGYAGDPQLFLTPAQLLRPAQLWVAFNNLWLIAPLAPLLLVSALWGWGQSALRRDRNFRYLTGVAAGLLVYHFSFQNDLPRWRDWDLFAIGGPGLTLWGIYPLLHGYSVQRQVEQGTSPVRSHAESGDASWWLPPLLFASLFTLAWIGVNHHFTLIHPNPDQRTIYQRYQVLDLTEVLPRATIIPATPICAEATGCERVKVTTFTMPEDGDSRPTIFAHAPARIELPLTVPRHASFLWLSPALEPEARGWGGDGVTFTVAVRANGQETTLWSRHLTPAQPADLDWQTVFVPLDLYRGQTVTLILVTDPGPAHNDAADRAGWGLPWLMLGTPDERFGH